MAIQTAVGQRRAQPGVQQDQLSAPSAPPVAVQPQQGEQRVGSVQPAQGQGVAPGPSPTDRNVTAAAIVGVAAVAIGAVFAIGLFKSRLEPAGRQIMARAQDVQVPMLLPLTLVEIARGLLADRNAPPILADRHHPG